MLTIKKLFMAVVLEILCTVIASGSFSDINVMLITLFKSNHLFRVINILCYLNK